MIGRENNRVLKVTVDLLLVINDDIGKSDQPHLVNVVKLTLTIARVKLQKVAHRMAGVSSKRVGNSHLPASRERDTGLGMER
jgi:hypothetical protein